MIQSHPGFFQELDIPIPITANELLTDHDYEIISNPELTSGFETTANIAWVFDVKNVGNAGFLINKTIARRIQEYIGDTFTIPFLPRSMKLGQSGRTVFPATLVCFTEDNMYHREGITEDIGKSDQRISAHGGRLGYALNFKLVGPEENSGTFFGEPDETILGWERTAGDLVEEHYVKQQSKMPGNFFTQVKETEPQEDYVYNHYIGDSVAFQHNTRRSGIMNHPDINQHDHITTVAKKEGFNKPYIINLAKYHRVDMTPSQEPRVALRFHGNWQKYSFDDIQRLYNEGSLLK